MKTKMKVIRKTQTEEIKEMEIWESEPELQTQALPRKYKRCKRENFVLMIQQKKQIHQSNKG